MVGPCHVCKKEAFLSPLMASYASAEINMVCSPCLRVLGNYKDAMMTDKIKEVADLVKLRAVAMRDG